MSEAVVSITGQEMSKGEQFAFFRWYSLCYKPIECACRWHVSIWHDYWYATKAGRP